MSTARLIVERVDDVDADSIMLGGDSGNPTWEEYLEKFKEEFRPHMMALRAHLEREGLVGITAEAMQDANEGAYRFSDGTEISFTWRAWGDLMQAIVNKREGYMRYYM